MTATAAASARYLLVGYTSTSAWCSWGWPGTSADMPRRTMSCRKPKPPRGRPARDCGAMRLRFRPGSGGRKAAAHQQSALPGSRQPGQQQRLLQRGVRPPTRSGYRARGRFMPRAAAITARDAGDISTQPPQGLIARFAVESPALQRKSRDMIDDEGPHFRVSVSPGAVFGICPPGTHTHTADSPTLGGAPYFNNVQARKKTP